MLLHSIGGLQRSILLLRTCAFIAFIWWVLVVGSCGRSGDASRSEFQPGSGLSAFPARDDACTSYVHAAHNGSSSTGKSPKQSWQKLNTKFQSCTCTRPSSWVEITLHPDSELATGFHSRGKISTLYYVGRPSGHAIGCA